MTITPIGEFISDNALLLQKDYSSGIIPKWQEFLERFTTGLPKELLFQAFCSRALF